MSPSYLPIIAPPHLLFQVVDSFAMHIHILLCTSFKEAYWSSLLALVETHQPFLLLFSYIRALVGTFHSFVGQ
uniref:Uncharacterized protein n=2 Tax=Aegilops tauschii subsp. strangulata TaxID=200361 RepID=A0A453MYT1_AEGTS